jgi:hypothetical protein
VVQRVALRADALDIKAQLSRPDYALLKIEDPIEKRKQSFGRADTVMARYWLNRWISTGSGVWSALAHPDLDPRQLREQ